MKVGFVIDSSSLIRLARENPRQQYRQLWDRIEALIADGRLVAPREVRREIEKGDDELEKWAKRWSEMFVDPDQSQAEFLEQIGARFLGLVDPERTSAHADPWVVALALALNSRKPHSDVSEWVVVTEELSRGGSSTKIPDVCAALGLQSINLLALLSMHD